MSKPKPYEGKRIPASSWLINGVDRILQAVQRQQQALQAEFDLRVNDLAQMERERETIPENMVYNVGEKAWVTRPAKPEIVKP